ncbi:hypothetical protein B7494_g638 [Chlorociboria aeruginascens]|nr:hypothetical protein B7494_g638 [Chlorociboria aeruginascens]
MAENNDTTHGSNESFTKPNRFDPRFTQQVVDSMGPATSPRMREVMSALINHVHDFARETNLTVDEWMAGVNMLNWAGKLSDDKRNEGQLVCGVIGLESLLDNIAYELAVDADTPATASAILGPFFRHDAPLLENGSSIVHGIDDGEMAYMHGSVFDQKTKKPVVGAMVDVWQASTNGLYEQQDKDQVDYNLRGRFKTDKEGRYAFYCLRPTSYPIPNDGPAGRLLKLMDRHPFRPAHIHLIVQHDSYKPLTTQIFDSKDNYLDNDSVFAVKNSLVVDFVPLEGNPKATLELDHSFILSLRD